MASATENHKTQALVTFKAQLEQRVGPQIANALPAHMPPERFQRVVLTAVQRNPDLLDCDRQSFFNAAMQAAQDGLLPDGREGALVKYGKEVQWLPMVFGIQKKARNSGDLSGINSFVVLKADEYRHWVDENGEHLQYEPATDRPHVTAENCRQLVRLVFAMARTKDGEVFIEAMSLDELDKVRSMSKAKRDDSPWVQWWGEMARKSAIKRLSKRLPMSSDLDDVLRRDDELYDLNTRVVPQTLDMSAIGNDTTSTAPPLPPPAQSEQSNANEPEGGKEAAPPSDKRPGGSSSQSPSSSERGLVEEVADALLDCLSHPACDDVAKLFQLEISAAAPVVRERVEKLIVERKAEISKAADDFPGDR